MNRDMLDTDDNQVRINYLCTLGLVMTMFRVTAQDIRYGNKEVKEDAKKFLNSDWFEELCNEMDLDHERVKSIILHSHRTSSRSSYE